MVQIPMLNPTLPIKDRYNIFKLISLYATEHNVSVEKTDTIRIISYAAITIA